MRHSLCLVFLSVASCVAEEAPPPPKPASTVFSEATLLGQPTTGLHNRQLGEDCTVGRHGDCATSALCLKVGATLDGGFVCSRACENEDDCPAEFRCLEFLPGHRVCVPPPAWTPRVAAQRAAVDGGAP